MPRKGAANPYTSINGRMVTPLNPRGVMALRLPDADRDAFLKRHKTKLFEAYGTVMPEFVAVPDALLGNTKELGKYLAISYAHARSLKPKPTRKPARKR